MTPAYTLALAASLWTHPGGSPCNAAEPNPCWTGAIPTQAGEICDGDLVRMWGAHEGEAIGPFLMIVALDVAHLRAQGFRHRTRADGATCLPTLTDGEAHLVEACGNLAEIVALDSITAAAIRSTEYIGGGSSPAWPRTWGGASAYVAPPPLPPVYVAPRPSPAPYEPVTPPATPIPAIPLPASAWMLMAAVAMLGALAMGRRA